MVTALVSGSSGPGFEPWPGALCFVPEQNTYTLTVPGSPPRCINGYRKRNTAVNPALDQHAVQRGVEILLVASCCRKQDKLWGPFLEASGSYRAR